MSQAAATSNSKTYREFIEKLSTANKARTKQLTFEHQQHLFEPCSPATLITAARFMTPQDYITVLQERTNSNLCAYPTCSQPTKITRSAYTVDTETQTATKITEDPIEFCGKVCKKASSYYAFQIDKEPVWMRKSCMSSVVLLDGGAVDKTFIDRVKDTSTVNATEIKGLIREYAKNMSLNDTDAIQIKENANPVADVDDARDLNECDIPRQIDPVPKQHPEEMTDEVIEDIFEEENDDSNSETDSQPLDYEYTKGWSEEEDDQDDSKPALSRFGRLWVYFNHLVTPSTKLYLQNAFNESSQQNQASSKIHQTRRAIMSTTLIKTYNRLRREYGLNVIISDVVAGIVDTFMLNGDVLLGIDEICVCVVIMRVYAFLSHD